MCGERYHCAHSPKIRFFIPLWIKYAYAIVCIEQPQLSNDTDLKVETTTATTINVSFMKWDQKMIGGQAPDK